MTETMTANPTETTEAPATAAESPPSSGGDRYVIGEPHPNQKAYATYQTKPSVPEYTGGGYTQWRSYELRPETPGTSKEHVYVSVHRLLAIVECYDAERPLTSVLADLAEKDVHHTTGVPWANFGDSPNFEEPGIEVLRHGTHSEKTQTQRRAWAEDAKREVREKENQPIDGPETCDRCGDESDVLVECEAWPDDERCHECAKETANGHPIKL